MEIKYNTPIEVTKQQYTRLMNECDGIVAGREDNGKCYVMVWWMKYAYLVQGILK